MSQTARLLFLAVLALVLAACGGDDAKEEGSSKDADSPAQAITVPDDKLEAAVGQPQGAAAYVANMVAQCIAKQEKDDAPLSECEDPKLLGTFNETYAAALETGDAPEGVTVTIDAADSFSATARSADIDGIGVVTWTYLRKPGSSEYANRCSPDIVGYCKDGAEVKPYYG